MPDNASARAPAPAPPLPPAGEPRHGQWVKFAADVPGAHATADGKTLGIYQRARMAPQVRLAADGTPEPAPEPVFVPAHVAVVRGDGTNLMELDEAGHVAVRVVRDPGACPDLQAADVPADLPRCDRTAHLFDDAPAPRAPAR